MSVSYLFGLFAAIVVGAVLPVVPTGAAVSVAAALAEREDLPLIALVVAFGAAGAYVADLGTYAVLHFAGQRVTDGSGRLDRWLHRRRQGAALDRIHRELEEHGVRTLLLSRLVPGGQVPVLVAAALGGYSWRRFAVADIAAAVGWSAMYAASGLAGRAMFPSPWEGVAAGIALVLAISLAGQLWSRSRTTNAAVRRS